MQKRLLLSSENFDISIRRLCYQLIENHDDFSNSDLIGIQPRGIFVAERIHAHLSQILKTKSVHLGFLDITFYRDDFRKREINSPSATRINFEVENKKIILIDDVLFTGRTIRAGMDALLDLGRPEKIELLTLIDRRYSRHLPISPDYTGIQVDTIASEKVIVQWKDIDGEDAVWLI